MRSWAKTVARMAALAIMVATLASSPALGQAPPRKKGEQLLYQVKPFDRVELVNDDTLDVEPVRINAGVTFAVGEDEYVGRPGLPPTRELKRQVRYRIRRADDGEEYYLLGRSIKKITFFEDMLLTEARKLIDQIRFEEAHQTLSVLVARDPKWPGLVDLRIENLLREAERLAINGQFTRALAGLFEEKRLRDERASSGITAPLFVDGIERPVATRIESLIRRWFDASVSAGQWGEARRVVARLEELSPGSALITTLRGEVNRRADEAIAQADRLRKSGNPRGAAASLATAIAISPDSPSVRAAAAEMDKAYPVLNVAVARLSTFRVPFARWTLADRRVAELLHLPLERLVGQGEEAKFESAIIANIEKQNVNKRAVLTVREGIVWPGDAKPVSIIDLHRLLAESCRPESDLYHPAFARLVAGLRTEFPDKLVIDFDRPQFQPAAWLQIPFLRVSYDPSLSSDARVGHSGLGPFRWAEQTQETSNFTANERFVEAGRPVIREVIERRIPSAAARLRAIEDQTTDLVVDVPPRLLPKAKGIQGALLISLNRPTIHLLQFNLRKKEMRHRTLRRAIDLAIDRPRVFAAVGQPVDDQNRVITGPLPVGSFGDNPDIKPRAFDPLLARILVQSVRKELGSLPPLRILCSAEETVRQAAGEIARMLTSVGLPTTAIEEENELGLDPFSIDMRYETYAVGDPIHDVVTLLTLDNPTLIEHGAPWLRQMIIDLIDVPNITTAGRVLPEIHRALYDDIAVLPLWQWTESILISERLKGVTVPTPSRYHGVARWTVSRGFPPAGWSTAPGEKGAGSP